MSQVQVVRGQTRNSVMKKIAPLLAEGWQLQGAVAQEQGWGKSIRYAATIVWNPPTQAAPQQPVALAPAPPPAPDPLMNWAVAEIQRLQQHCQHLEARVRALEARR